MPNKFKSNFSKKEYERHASNLKIIHKKNTTVRDLELRKLETSKKYDNDFETLPEKIPKGVTLSQITNDKLLLDAKEQILNVMHNYDSLENNKMTNYRFYIGTPYFDRKGNDPFPLFNLDDPNISSISKLVLKNDLLNMENIDLLNIVVRVYKYGDILNFHSDRDIFGENIYGIIVHNADEFRGLILTNNKSQYMIPEIDGLTWHLSGDARWNYEHGYVSKLNANDQDEIVRISISFRFFQNAAHIPKKEYEKNEIPLS
jgi:hypothetical protein